MTECEFRAFVTFGYRLRPDHGQFVKPVPVPKGMRHIMRSMRVKECYGNAARFLSRFPEAEYVLGFAAGILPVEHAWVYHDGQYYDPTWERHLDAPGNTYLEIIRLDYKTLTGWCYEHNLMPPSLHDLSRAGLIPDPLPMGLQAH